MIMDTQHGLILFISQGYIQYSVFFYGYYGNVVNDDYWYRVPLAYFVAGMSAIALSFLIILRR